MSERPCRFCSPIHGCARGRTVWVPAPGRGGSRSGASTSSQHSLKAGWAFGASQPKVDYPGEFHRSNSRITTGLTTYYSGLEVLRFYGFGNDTTPAEDDHFNKVRQKHVVFLPSLTLPVARSVDFTIAPALQYAKTEEGPRLIDEEKPYGYGEFGQVGGWARLRLDTRRSLRKDSLQLPLRGTGGAYPVSDVFVEAIGAVFPKAWDVEETYGWVEGNASTFLTAGAKGRATLALRVGGKHMLGDRYPFHNAAAVGGGSLFIGQDAVRGLHPAGPWMLLKGAGYIAQDMPFSHGRLPADVDLMVPRSSLDGIERGLLDAGWEVEKNEPYDQHYYRAWSHELPPMIAAGQAMELDLHHTILPPVGRIKPDTARLFADAVPVPGSPFHVLCPKDQVLHAVVHLVYDSDFVGRLRDLLDIDALFRRLPLSDSAARHALVERARLHGMEKRWAPAPMPCPTCAPSRPGLISIDSLDGSSLDVKISSSGELKISGGQIQKQRIELSSSGDYQARGMASTSADIDLTSSGSATVWVSDRLSGSLSSSGNIYYVGNPKVNVRMTSSGKVKQIDQ